MIDLVRVNAFKTDANAEISKTIATPVLLQIFQEVLLQSQEDFFKTYSNVKTTCKYLHDWVEQNGQANLTVLVRHFLFPKFNAPVLQSIKQQYSMNKEFLHKDIALIFEENTSEFINLMILKSELKSRFGCPPSERLKLINESINKLVTIPGDFHHDDNEVPLQTALFKKCVENNSVVVSKRFSEIPFLYLEIAEEVGVKCAEINPVAVFKNINNFKNMFEIVEDVDYCDPFKINSYNLIINAANEELKKRQLTCAEAIEPLPQRL